MTILLPESLIDQAADAFMRDDLAGRIRFDEYLELLLAERPRPRPDCAAKAREAAAKMGARPTVRAQPKPPRRMVVLWQPRPLLDVVGEAVRRWLRRATAIARREA
jgi:hypothetical protein